MKDFVKHLSTKLSNAIKAWRFGKDKLPLTNANCQCYCYYFEWIRHKRVPQKGNDLVQFLPQYYYMLRMKRAKGRKPKKDGWEPRILGQEEGGLDPCSPCSIEMTRVLCEKIQKHPLRAPKSFLWSWLKFIFTLKGKQGHSYLCASTHLST